MKKPYVLLLALLFAGGPELLAQQAPAPQSQPVPAPQSAPAAVKHTPDGKLILEDGTPIRLRTKRNLSSADCKTGDQVDFEVLEPVVLDGITIIPQGGIAMGKITEAQPKRRMGRGGKLNVVIEYVKMANGERAALRAVKDVSGGGHVGAMTGAMVATGIVFFPAAPLFLFMHGKDITIPSGTEFAAYVSADTVFNPPPTAPDAAAAGAAPAPVGTTELALTSVPDGADIEVDGAFVGSTPSTVHLAAGDHSVRVTQKGYQPYQKLLRVSGGKISLRAELEKQNIEPPPNPEPVKVQQ